MDLESLQGMFGDPEALLGELLTPESRRSSDQLTALAVVIDAYADHVANLVGQKLVGSHSQLAEAWYRRRTERGKGEEAAGALFGLDLDQTQVDRGRSFVSGVVERAGEDGLAALWTSARNLPTPSEVDAPGLWLERISLPELDEPSPGTEPTPGPGRRRLSPRRPCGGLRWSSAAAGSAGSRPPPRARPRSHSRRMFSRSASRITRSRFRRYWGSWGGSRTSRAMVRRRNSSMRAGSPKSERTSQWGATGPRYTTRT